MSVRSRDVLVVGGGIIGLACAYYLQREGLRVTLIDKDAPGQACSLGNCGLICPSHVLPLALPGVPGRALRSILRADAAFRVAPQLRPELYRWLYRFMRRCDSRTALATAAHLKRILDASMAEYRQLAAIPAIAAAWNETGCLSLFLTEEALREYESSVVEPIRELGVDARVVSPDRIRQLTPGVLPQVCGGVLFPGDAFVQPERLIEGWLAVLRAAGVEVHTHAEVRDVAVSAGRIDRVITARTDYAAAHYVFALGSWSRNLRRWLNLDVPVEPGKGYSAMLERPDACPTLPLLFPECDVVATPFRTGLRLGSMMEFVGFDGSVPARRVRQLAAAAERFIRMPGDRAVRDTWMGWRPMTWDSLPILGRVPRIANATIATGHNMLGMTLAPATGRSISDVVMERTPFIDIAPFSPDRFQAAR